MGSSPDEKRRKGRKRRRSEVDEKEMLIAIAVRKLRGAIQDYKRTVTSRKRLHSSSSSSSTSDSSATSSSSSACSTSSFSTSGLSTSSASSSEPKYRRNRRIRERSRSRSRHRRHRKYKDGGWRISQNKSHRKSRSRDVEPKSGDEKLLRDSREPRKRFKIEYSSHGTSKRTLRDSRDNSQSRARTSGLTSEICSSNAKGERHFSETRTRSRDKRKILKKKVPTANDDRKTSLPCPQDAEVPGKDSDEKIKHYYKTDMGTRRLSDNDRLVVIDDAGKKQKETSGSSDKISSNDKKTDRDDVRKKNRSRDQKRSNKEKVTTENDDEERFLSSRQDTVKHSYKRDIQASASDSISINSDRHPAIDNTNDKPSKSSSSDLKISKDANKVDKSNSECQKRRRDKKEINKDTVNTNNDNAEKMCERQNLEIPKPISQDQDCHKSDIYTSGFPMMARSVDESSFIDNLKKRKTKSADDNKDSMKTETQASNGEKVPNKDDHVQSAVDIRSLDNREKKGKDEHSKHIVQDYENASAIMCSQTQIDSLGLTGPIPFVNEKSFQLNDNEKNHGGKDPCENKSEQNISQTSEGHSVKIGDSPRGVNSDDCENNEQGADKIQHIVDKGSKLLHKEDHYSDQKIVLLTDKTEHNTEVGKNDEILVTTNSETAVSEENGAETILENTDDDGDNLAKILKKKEQAVNENAVLSDKETVGIKIDLQSRNAHRSSIEDEGSDDMLQDLLSWFPPEEFGYVYGSDDECHIVNNEKRNPEEKVQKVVDAEIFLKVNTDDENPCSEKSQSSKCDDDEMSSTMIEGDKYKSQRIEEKTKKLQEIVKKNNDISLKDKPTPNTKAKLDEAEKLFLEFVENDGATNEKSSQLDNVEVTLEESPSKTEVPNKESGIFKKNYENDKEGKETVQKLEKVETSNSEKNETQKSNVVHDSVEINNDESEIEETLEEFLDTSVSQKEENLEDKIEHRSKNVGNSGQLSSEKTVDTVDVSVFKSMLNNTCVFHNSMSDKDKLTASKNAEQIETHLKNDSAIEDGTTIDSPCKIDEKIVPEEIAGESELQLISSGNQITDQNALNSDESFSPPKSLRESDEERSMLSAVSRVLETAVKSFDAGRNKDADEKLSTVNSESSEHSVKEFSSQKNKHSVAKEPGTVLKSSAIEKKLSSRGTKNFGKEEPQIAPKSSVESATEFTVLKSTDVIEKELHTFDFSAKSTENIAQQETENDLGRATFGITKLPAESVEKLKSETENLVEKEPSMTQKLATELKEKSVSQETKKTAEKTTLEIELMEVKLSNSVIEATENIFPHKSDKEIEDNVPAVNSTVDIVTTDHHKDVENTQKVEEHKASQKIIENVPAAHSTVEIVTTDHQEDAEKTHEVAKKDVEQKLSTKTENPMFSAVDDILTSALEKFGAARRKYLADKGLTEDFNSSDTEDSVEMLSCEWSNDSSEDFSPKAIRISTEMKVSISPKSLLKSSEEFPSQEMKVVDEKTATLAPETFSKSSEEFNSQKTTSFTETTATKVPEILSALSEEFPPQKIKISTENSAMIAPKMFFQSEEKFPPQEIEIFTEKSTPMNSETQSKASEPFPTQELEVSTAKELTITPEFSTKSVNELALQDTENFAVDSPIASETPSELSEESALREIVNLDDKETPIAFKLPTELQEHVLQQENQNFDAKQPLVTSNFTPESSAEFCLPKTKSSAENESLTAPEFSGESPQAFAPQKTEGPVKQQSSVTPKFQEEFSDEFSSQETNCSIEKEPPICLEFSAESSQELSSKQTISLAKNQSSVSPELPEDFSDEFCSQETKSSVDKEPPMALELPEESSQRFSSKQIGGSIEKQSSVALKFTEEFSNEFSSQETNSSVEKEPPMDIECSEESSQEFFSNPTGSHGKKQPLVVLKLPKDLPGEFSSQETEISVEKQSPINIKVQEELSQGFSSEQTGNPVEKQLSVAPKLPEDFSDEISSQEMKSSVEKDPLVSTQFAENLSQGFSAEKQSALNLPFPEQPMQEYSSKQVENDGKNEKPIFFELSAESSQDFSSQAAENLSEASSIEIDSPDLSDIENTSSDSSPTIISKVEPEREDYKSLAYSFKRKNSTTSVNANLQDENAKGPQIPENILPLITKTIKNNPKKINDASKNEVSDFETSKDICYRSKQEIVNKYRALPSSRKVVGKSRKNLERSLSSPIDIENESVPAINLAGSLEIGSTIDSSITDHFASIILRGLSEETKEKLIAKHKPAENSSALRTPLLDPNFRHFMEPNFLRKDEELVRSQNQLAAAISAIGKALSIIQKENVAPEAKQTLGEAGKILADLHHENFVQRRLQTTREIGNFMDKVAGKSVVDRLLFESSDLGNFEENQASTSGREIGMLYREENAPRILRLRDKSAEYNSDDENDREIPANFSKTTTASKTQPVDTGIRKILFSSSAVEKSAESFAVYKKDNKIVTADPKTTETPIAEAISNNKNTGLKLKSAREKICALRSASEDSPEIIFVGQRQPEAIKTSISSRRTEKSVEKFGANKNVRKIASVAPEMTNIPALTASESSTTTKLQSAISGMINSSNLSNEAQKSVKILANQETTEKSMEPKNLTIKTVTRNPNENLSPLPVTMVKIKPFGLDVPNTCGSPVPNLFHVNRFQKIIEQSDSPRCSKIVIKSDTLVKPSQKMSIGSGFPSKSVTFVSPTIPTRRNPLVSGRPGTPWKSKSVNNVETVVPSSTASSEIPEAWGTVKVQAKGAGYAILQMTVQYNVDIKKYQTPPPVQAFDLVVRPHFYGRNQSHITYFSCQRWINVNESSRSGMAVLDVTIPTGYIVQQQNLDQYIRSRQVRNLQRARFQDRKVLFYFDYLDQEETCVNFTVERWFPVANMSRYLPVRVYDYYSPERFNETIFDSLATYVLNICEVCGSSQCPYCHIYNAASLIVPPTSFVFLLSIFTATARYFRTQQFSVG